VGLNSSNHPEGQVVSELSLVEGVRRVPVPPPNSGNQYICPQCERPIPPLRLVFLGKPPQYAHLLNDIIKCTNRDEDGRECRYIFSYRSEVLILRR